MGKLYRDKYEGGHGIGAQWNKRISVFTWFLNHAYGHHAAKISIDSTNCKKKTHKKTKKNADRNAQKYAKVLQKKVIFFKQKRTIQIKKITKKRWQGKKTNVISQLLNHMFFLKPQRQDATAKIHEGSTTANVM
jgi:hypothetical protein